MILTQMLYLDPAGRLFFFYQPVAGIRSKFEAISFLSLGKRKICVFPPIPVANEFIYSTSSTQIYGREEC